MALNCTIPARRRTMSGAARGGLPLCQILSHILPSKLWLLKEVACVTGLHDDLNKAKRLGCILREDLELRARAEGQTLIPAAALVERGVEGGPCHAERMFGLDNVEKREDWFKTYTTQLLNAILPPLIDHGVALEAHGQDILVHFSLSHALHLLGFAMRDLGGIKLHIPTIRDHNPEIASLDLDAYSTKENLEEVWASVYMVVVRCHLEQSVHALGLQNEGGWAVVREALGKVVDGMGPHERARELYEVFT